MQTAEGKFEMDYETLIEQATEAQTLLAQLLECNCKYSITLSWIEIFTYWKLRKLHIFYQYNHTILVFNGGRFYVEFFPIVSL